MRRSVKARRFSRRSGGVSPPCSVTGLQVLEQLRQPRQRVAILGEDDRRLAAPGAADGSARASSTPLLAHDVQGARMRSSHRRSSSRSSRPGADSSAPGSSSADDSNSGSIICDMRWPDRLRGAPAFARSSGAREDALLQARRVSTIIARCAASPLDPRSRAHFAHVGLERAMHVAFGERRPHAQRQRPARDGQADVATRAAEGQERKAVLEIADAAERLEGTVVARMRRRGQEDDGSRATGERRLRQARGRSAPSVRVLRRTRQRPRRAPRASA